MNKPAKTRKHAHKLITPHMAYKGYVRWLRGLGTVRVYRNGMPANHCLCENRLQPL